MKLIPPGFLKRQYTLVIHYFQIQKRMMNKSDFLAMLGESGVGSRKAHQGRPSCAKKLNRKGNYA